MLCRNYGVFIYNIENRQNPYIAGQILKLSGAEYILLFPKNDNILAISDKINGFKLFNVTNKTNPTLISEILT